MKECGIANMAMYHVTKDLVDVREWFNSLCNWVMQDYPQRALQNKGIVDSGCSRHMTRNKVYLAESSRLLMEPLLHLRK
ncbi:hypothetical protein Tco_0266970 [Tanacetum coccineum]